MNFNLPKTSTALVIIDLQLGILEPEPVPFGKKHIVAQAVALGRAFVDAKAPIVLTRTDYSPGYADAPKGTADSPWSLPNDGLPAAFATLVPDSVEAFTPFTKSSVQAAAIVITVALAAFVAPLGAAPKRLDGVVLAEPHEVVGAQAAEGLATWRIVCATFMARR